MHLTYTTRDEEGTRALGAALGRSLAPDGVLLLTGDLGSGKTVVTQGLATALGIDYRQVQSPSFTLVREHEGDQGQLIHIDLYRLDNADLEALGLWEILAGPGVKAVEWGDKLPFEVPGAVRLSVEVLELSHERRFEIRGIDAAEVLLTGPESPGTDDE